MKNLKLAIGLTLFSVFILLSIFFVLRERAVNAQNCTDVGLGTPIVDSVVEWGKPFTISCPANSNTYDCITGRIILYNDPKNPSNFAHVQSCYFYQWSGNNAVFKCNYIIPEIWENTKSWTAECRVEIGTKSNCCSAYYYTEQTKTQKDFTVTSCKGCRGGEYYLCDDGSKYSYIEYGSNNPCPHDNVPFIYYLAKDCYPAGSMHPSSPCYKCSGTDWVMLPNGTACDTNKVCCLGECTDCCSDKDCPGGICQWDSFASIYKCNNPCKDVDDATGCVSHIYGKDATYICHGGKPATLDCPPWENEGCGVSPCSSTQMKQKRSCTPAGCGNYESQCVSDPSCGSQPPPCSNIDLGIPLITPSVPTAGDSFQISCPSSSDCDCIEAYANDKSNQCSWLKWDAQNKRQVFSCSGMTAGNYVAGCQSKTGTASNCCQDAKTTSYSIVVSPPKLQKKTIQLYRGWNLIATLFGGYKASLNCSYHPELFYWNAKTQAYEKIDSLDKMEIARGYWIFTENDCKLDFSGQ